MKQFIRNAVENPIHNTNGKLKKGTKFFIVRKANQEMKIGRVYTIRTATGAVREDLRRNCTCGSDEFARLYHTTPGTENRNAR